MPVAVCFHRFGPYHMARLAAAATQMDIVGIEFSSHTSEYAWDTVQSEESFRRVVIVPDGDIRTLSKKTQKELIWSALDSISPEVIAINGWATFEALTTLAWAVRNHVPRIIMSESTAWDFQRYGFREQIKKHIISLVQSALVGGTAHVNYLKQLGFPGKKIFMGYDVVDNSYFNRMAEKIRAEKYSSPITRSPYFLTSCRFIKKKNLFRLFDAFARYRKNLKQEGWHMIVLGDGYLRPELEKYRDNLQLKGTLHLPGFKQYNELPYYYAPAEVYIQPSTTEQWGLVVNEAMASGLPVLVSERCGCAHDLVRNGHNGYSFDPYNVDQLTELMTEISSNNCDRPAMGRTSLDIIRNWTPGRFAEGLENAVATALASPLQKPRWHDQLLLQGLQFR